MTGEPRMLTRVARMYHEDGLPQREIAARLSLSQSRVSRLLRRAGEAGIVRTVVVPPAGVHAGLEDALRKLFGLRDAVVADGDTHAALGAATAGYLDATVAGGDRKSPAIRAALRGGWISVLITDTASAQRLAEETP